MNILIVLVILFEVIYNKSIRNNNQQINFTLIQYNLIKLQISLNNNIVNTVRKLKVNKLINLFDKHIYNYNWLNIFIYKNYIGSDSFYMNINTFQIIDGTFDFSINVLTKYNFGFGEKNHKFFMNTGKYHSWPADNVSLN
jgi:hypothetical protein